MSDIQPFTVDHFLALGGDAADIHKAIVNQISGYSFTLTSGGVALAAGGVRTQGIGEAWAMIAPDAKEHHVKSLLRATREVLHECIVRERLYKLYAEATVNAPDWFEHLKFRKRDNLLMRIGDGI